jgi:hypothetical protein
VLSQIVGDKYLENNLHLPEGLQGQGWLDHCHERVNFKKIFHCVVGTAEHTRTFVNKKFKYSMYLRQYKTTLKLHSRSACEALGGVVCRKTRGERFS